MQLKKYPYALAVLPAALSLALGMSFAPNVMAQDAEEEMVLEEVVVTGSRIRKDPLNEPAPIMNLSENYIDNTGLTNLGAVLQQLPIILSEPQKMM